MAQLFNSQFFQLLLHWLAPISLITFLLSLLLIPWVVSNLSIDSFLNLTKPKQKSMISAKIIGVQIIRNICGLLLLLAGIAMLFLPGQGILTILLGLLLLTFPGKQKILNYLIHEPTVQHSLDWIRKKSGKPSFNWPENNY